MASAVRCRHPSSCDADLIRSSASVSIFCGFAPPITIVRSCPSLFFVPILHVQHPFILSSSYRSPSIGSSTRRNRSKSVSFPLTLQHRRRLPQQVHRLVWRFWFSALLARPSSAAAAIFAIIHRWLFTFLVLNALLSLTAWILPSRHLFSSI